MKPVVEYPIAGLDYYIVHSITDKRMLSYANASLLDAATIVAVY